jgi:hypothetical protein
MRNSRQHDNVCQQPSRSAPARLLSAPVCCSWVMRYLLVGATLLTPASMVMTVSCGLNCSTRCEPESVGPLCFDFPAYSCVDGGAHYPCAVGTGCRCSGVSSSNLAPTGCNTAACDSAKDQSTCLTKPGCEWGDACQDLINCHSFDNDESACSANVYRCVWHRDCG